MVPAPLTPTPGFPANWPTDGRAGGVPDPSTSGPDIIQIGNEGGLLPAPAIWPAQPVTYDQNVRSMTIFNVLHHGLLMGAAERADVIIDFSKYAGQTLILYNDAPAPMPGFDPRIDYFTGDGDQTGGGGAYNTPAGYGPNTRTIMQIKVNPVVTGATPASSVQHGSFGGGMPVAYAASQPHPNISETVYNTALGTSIVDNYANIFAGSNTQPNFNWSTPGYLVASGLGSVVLQTSGVGYQTAPTVSINGQLPLGGTGATATATISGGQVTSVTITNPGTGYLTSPTVSFSGGKPTTPATASITSYPGAVVQSSGH